MNCEKENHPEEDIEIIVCSELDILKCQKKRKLKEKLQDISNNEDELKTELARLVREFIEGQREEKEKFWEELEKYLPEQIEKYREEIEETVLAEIEAEEEEDRGL